ncbi:MAG: M48 family metallopeptidase [Desulfobacterales bacterium]|nr:M48 family metallopeptidase [Desulfobacterales bacterium]
MKYTPRLPESNDNVTPTSPLKDFFIMAGGLLVIIVGVYLALGFAVDLIVPRLSPEIEKKMAGSLLAMKDGTPGDPAMTGSLQSLLDRLQNGCTHLPYAFRVHVYRDKKINALAMPGGHIVVFTGLLDKVLSENELAFVLAHELGHYAHRDHLRGMGRALVFMAMSAFIFGPDSRVGGMLSHGLKLTEMRFSRHQETRADEFALDAVHCLYGHVAGATDFFHRIAGAQDPGAFGHYFSTHPENQRRIDHLETIIGEKRFGMGKKSPLPADLKGRMAGASPPQTSFNP